MIHKSSSIYGDWSFNSVWCRSIYDGSHGSVLRWNVQFGRQKHSWCHSHMVPWNGGSETHKFLPPPPFLVPSLLNTLCNTTYRQDHNKENPKMEVLSMEKSLPVARRSRRKTKMVETKDTERAMDERVWKFQEELKGLIAKCNGAALP